MNEQNNFIVKSDMICPIANQHCDDECCTVGSICNISGNSNEICRPTDELTEQDYKVLLNLVDSDINSIQNEINNNADSFLSLEYLFNTRTKMEEISDKLQNILNTF